MQLVQRVRTEKLGLAVKPPVNLIGRQLTELPRAKSRDDMRLRQNGIPRDRVCVPTRLTELQPVIE